MADAATTLESLKQAVWRFADERAWHPFHNPKNLVMGLAIETAELMEHFLWVEGSVSRYVADDAEKRTAISDEMADVACHLFNLANSLKIDLSEAVTAKLAKNAKKYPVEKYRGKYQA
jgi:dCTP diphosphatase